MKWLTFLLSCGAFAQTATVWTGTWSNGASASTIAGIRFETRFDPPNPPLAFIAGSSGRTIYRTQGSYSATHRYFRNDNNSTYVGYDLLVEQDTQPDSYRLTFLELGIGPLDFALNPYTPSRATEWKKLATPPLPAAMVVHGTDKVDVTVWFDPGTGQKLIDTIQIQQSPQNLNAQILPNITQRLQMVAPRNVPTVPTASGTAREFQAGDAEMHLIQPNLTLNGKPPDNLPRAGTNANGTLVWFYVPKHGRYVLSLVPRPDLGFTQAGEVRGGAIHFKSDGDEIVLETYQPIAPGSAPYLLYVLHDKEWEPTARNQTERLLFGSVSPAEIASLMKK